MTCDCSSAPKMLTTLQHQRTYCVPVYFRMIMYLAVVSVLVCTCIAPSAHAQSCTLPDCFVNGTNEIQCISCPVGFGVEVKDRELMLCSNSPPRNTNCEPCIAGVNFSDTNDLGSQCLECLVCHSTKEVETKECTATSDRECTCSEQYYYNVGLQSCFPCRTCGEDEQETIQCTPTVNRECGRRIAPPVITTSVPPTANQTMSTSTVSTGPPDETGMSTKAETGGKPLSTGVIVAIVIGVVVVVVVAIIACLVLYQRGSKCTRDTWTGGEGGGGSPLTLNCCIGNQTNKYNNPIPTVSMNGLNGTPHYQQVPDAERNGDVGRQPNGDVGRQPNGDVGRQPNGDVSRQPNWVIARQHSATSSTTEETEHQQSVEDALFSAEIRERVIRALDANDGLMRNAHMLASKNFSRGTYNLQATNTPASDVLDMWVRQGKTKAELITALRKMERDDVADICEEDSAGS